MVERLYKLNSQQRKLLHFSCHRVPDAQLQSAGRCFARAALWVLPQHRPGISRLCSCWPKEVRFRDCLGAPRTARWGGWELSISQTGGSHFSLGNKYFTMVICNRQPWIWSSMTLLCFDLTGCWLGGPCCSHSVLYFAPGVSWGSVQDFSEAFCLRAEGKWRPPAFALSKYFV